MKIFREPVNAEIAEIIKRPLAEESDLSERVQEILNHVRSEGDRALREYSFQFDKVRLETWWVAENEFQEASTQVSLELKNAIDTAIENVKKFHLSQKHEEARVETQQGILCWRRSIAISSIGLYIPGGTAPLFSTAIMSGVPAVLAGCKNIVAMTPPLPDGRVSPVILYTLERMGIKRVLKLGGAHAIAAIAFGTETIPKVHKIFGPGNRFVTTAKQLVAQSGVAIDMPAGPSEVAVLADEEADPSFVASDLLAQAEHGSDSQVLLVSNSEAVVLKTQQKLEEQLKDLPRAEIARAALACSRAVVVKDFERGMEIVNAYAPEHLVLQVADYKKLVPLIENVGSVFLGKYSPVSAGDYASGTNHILPTNRNATCISGISLDSFLKKVTFQEVTQEGLRGLARTVEVMAMAEGLDAHARAISIRLGELS